jgi:NADH-quinone oxidoreductase subunit K
MFNIALEHFLFLGAILFTLGVLGIFLNKKNLIIILMSIELILLSVNINFISFSSYLGEISGQIFAMIILTVAAAEAAIGLAILVVFFRNQGSIAVEKISNLKG